MDNLILYLLSTHASTQPSSSRHLLICAYCATCGLQNLQYACAAAPRLARWPLSVPRAASSGMQVGFWPERHIEAEPLRHARLSGSTGWLVWYCRHA
jgi:hypothetical protein